MPGWLFSMTRLKQPPIQREDTGPSATSEAWIEASRRLADGRPDASAHLEAAWHSTEAWWLRPLANVVAIALGVSAGVPRRLAELGEAARSAAAKVLTPRQAKPAAAPRPVQNRKDYISEADGPAAVRALRQLELPFFATSSTFVNKPARGLVLSGRVRPSLQGRLLDAEAETRAVLEDHLTRELGHAVRVHLLRAESDDEQGYELFVADARPTGISEGAMAYSFVSLCVALAFCSQLGSPFFVKVAGAGAAAMAPGSVLPVGLLIGLLALGECARGVAAKSLGGAWVPPVFLPSPQLGFIGTFPAGKEAPYPSRSAALSAALAGPLAIAAGSALLMAYGILSGAAADITLATPFNIAWPLALLPQHCSAPFWAGAHGLVMAGLMLLPQSPAGQAAWQNVVGRQAAEQVSDFASYFYPLLGIICSSSTGPGWFVLPLWWAILVVNVAPSETQPALEEVSEVPIAARIAAGAVLCSAALAMAPLPLHELLLPGFFAAP